MYVQTSSYRLYMGLPSSDVLESGLRAPYELPYKLEKWKSKSNAIYMQRDALVIAINQIYCWLPT